MEFKLLKSVCTIAASHDFATIVTGLERVGQSNSCRLVASKWLKSKAITLIPKNN